MLLDWQEPIAQRMKDALSKERVFVCAATTGAGKTYLAADVIKHLKQPTLIICPKIAISQWKKVLKDEGVLPWVIDVINPEQISKRTGCKYYTRKDKWNIPNKTLVIFDEFHRGTSGEKSVTTEAVAYLKGYTTTKLLALSATPFDSPIKMKALAFWMDFCRFSQSAFRAWCQKHGCSYVQLGRFSPKYIFRFTSNVEKARAIMLNIREMMGDRYLSVTPEEIPNFPEETKEVMLLDLAAKDIQALNKAYEEMPSKMMKMSEDEMVQTLRLREQAEFCKASAITDLAMQYVEDGLSVFVMVNFTETRKRIEDILRENKVEFASIYGGQKELERQQGIDAFQDNKIHVIIGMAPACSVALSLHDVKHERRRVSIISPGYSSSEFVQGLGRIRRAGGTFATQKIVIAAGSVEERVGKTIERKMNNLSALTDNDLER